MLSVLYEATSTCPTVTTVPKALDNSVLIVPWAVAITSWLLLSQKTLPVPMTISMSSTASDFCFMLSLLSTINGIIITMY